MHFPRPHRRVIREHPAQLLAADADFPQVGQRIRSRQMTDRPAVHERIGDRRRRRAGPRRAGPPGHHHDHPRLQRQVAQQAAQPLIAPLRNTAGERGTSRRVRVPAGPCGTP
jgi:hypothetical protein